LNKNSIDVSKLRTEQRNPNSFEIDTKTTSEILTIINCEDATVPKAVTPAIPVISELVDEVVRAFKSGGRLFYIGAGTSGRLGVLDASECPPTFGVPPTMVQGIIAGGERALTTAVEWIEDNEQAGVDALGEVEFSSRDVLIGITASGQAPFVRAAMEQAASLGAVVGALACNKDSAIFEKADYKIFIDVGPEILTGSTRMKSGTAQKLVLNMITTTAMIKLGKVYNNFMVDLTPTNAKLKRRALWLVQEISGCDREEAERTLRAADNHVKTAILIVILGCDAKKASELLERHDGNLHFAITSGRGERGDSDDKEV
jgi:N-acetylmuramic acid 6-phosphate etherase